MRCPLRPQRRPGRSRRDPMPALRGGLARLPCVRTSIPARAGSVAPRSQPSSPTNRARTPARCLPPGSCSTRRVSERGRPGLRDRPTIQKRSSTAYSSADRAFLSPLGAEPIFPAARDRETVASGRGRWDDNEQSSQGTGRGPDWVVARARAVGNGHLRLRQDHPGARERLRVRDFIRKSAGSPQRKRTRRSSSGVRQAQDLKLPIAKKDIHLERTTHEMIISAKYTQTIDLKFTKYVYVFDHEERAPLF